MAPAGPGSAPEADLRLAQQVIVALRARGEWLGLAESMTGGLVASLLVAAKDTSKALRGGVVCYHPDVKVQVLGLPPALVAENDAVTRDVAKALAEAARDRLGADHGIGVTGFADHEDASLRGLVYLGLAGPGRSVDVRERRYRDVDRNGVRHAAAREALQWLLESLERP